MKTVLYGSAALVLTLWSGAPCAQRTDGRPELWDRPRTASVILGEESIKRAVAALLVQPDAQLVIHHAAAQDLELQAEELRAWLGALAIDPRRVALRADLAAPAPIRIEVIP